MTQNPGGNSDWPRIAVLGAGAVGCYFGGMLARAGAPVTLIGRARHMEPIAATGLEMETLQFHERLRLAASTDLAAVRNAEIVLFCVKTVDTETASIELEPHLSPRATVVVMQNGVDNVERIVRATQIAPVTAVVYVAASMVGPGHVKHSGRGDLIVGGEHPGADHVAGVFESAGVPCRVSQSIDVELWTKMVINCAYNAISALARAEYGRIARTPFTRDLGDRIIEEVVAVARAAGVPLDASVLIEAAHRLGEAMTAATSSTAQDIARGKPTEIDSLNGYIARRGASLGISTPINQTLWALVKLLEEKGGSAADERR